MNKKLNPGETRAFQRINHDIVALAGLAHDLGHPPFGHTGEKALHQKMRAWGGFEGNAQTFRILCTLERRLSAYHDAEDLRSIRDLEEQSSGLNLTYRSLAAVLKYDKVLGDDRKDDPSFVGVGANKGVYHDDMGTVAEIKNSILNQDSQRLYSVECQVMDLADDIAYSTFDLEDCLKAEYLHPLDFLANVSEDSLGRIVNEVNNGLKKRGIFEEMSSADVIASVMVVFNKMFQPSDTSEYDLERSNVSRALFTSLTYREGVELSRRGFLRREFSMQRISNAIQGIDLEYNEEFPIQSKIKIDDEIALEIECLKAFNFEMVIKSRQMREFEYAGSKVVEWLFEALMDDTSLLPADDLERLSIRVEMGADPMAARARVVCDYIAGMTDEFALGTYRKLYGGIPSFFGTH